MKTENLPMVILTENNLDFIFDIIDILEYRVGLGIDPGIENSKMREEERKDLQRWSVEAKNPAIVYIEFDPERKRYIPLTKWFEDNDEIRKFIEENINDGISSLPTDYFSKLDKS